MEIYVKTSFWIGVVSIVLRLILMAFEDWPRKKTETLGSFASGVIITLGFVVWAGIVLWMR